jgi:AcrR family transcriptional regulator
VARRAGVHESSIYRRWGGRSALVAEACREAARASVAVPDSGSLRKDLLALLQRVAAMWRSPVGRAMMQLTVAAEGDGELLAEIRRFWGERFALVGELFTRARVRGEWPAGADESLLLEALLGALLVRMHLSHRPTGAGWLQRLVDAMLPDPANGKQAKRNERRKQA